MAVSILATVLVSGVGVVAAAASSTPTPAYRTATVGKHGVEQLLIGVATVEPVSQAAVSFPAAGTVASVAVSVGDTVSIGTPLATLDPTSLESALTEAEAALAEAELTLERARTGESAGSPARGTGAVQTPATRTTDSPAGSVEPRPAGPSDDPELRRAEQAVIDGQKEVDGELAEADRALSSAKQTCAAVGEDAEKEEQAGDEAGGDTDDPSADDPEPGDDEPSADDPEPSDDEENASACYQALGEALEAQERVASSQKALAKASTELDQLRAQRAAEASKPDPSTSATAAPQQPEAPETSRTNLPSSEELVAYQKAIDAAEARVAVAEQALRQATITSPIAGTVLAVNMAANDTVTAASTTQTIVVKGVGGYEAVTMVKVTDLPDLAVGQAASFVPDGSDAIEGQVVSIGLVSASGTTGTTYPVTIGFTSSGSALRSGSAGRATIMTAAAEAALAVPTSAVALNNSRYTVTVLDSEEAEDVTVEVGAIGATWTEIKSGLESGQEVVLARLSEPLPGDATSTGGQQTTPLGGPGGGRPGGFQPPRN